MLHIEPAFLGENEGVFVRAERYKVFVIEFLDILNQQLVRLLDKDDISHGFAHPFLELLQFFTLIQK